MADASDPAITEAYERVRARNDETSWLLIDYESEKSNKLKLTGSGEGGLPGLKESGLLLDDHASFAYVRVDYANDEESKREKFVLVIWIGNQVKVMRKARVSVHAGDIKSVLRAFSIEVAASSIDDLDEGALVKRLRKAGGASYDGV